VPRSTTCLALLALLAAGGCTFPDGMGDTATGDTGGQDTSPPGDTSNPGDTQGQGGDTSEPPVPGTLHCAPGDTHLTIANGVAQTVQFSATITTDTGDVPATDAAWMLQGPGSIDANGLYTSPTDSGGQATIQAALDNRIATCTVEVRANAVINDSGNASVPGAFDSSTPTQSDTCDAQLLYPLDDSAMPGSFAPPLIQWSASSANMFEVILSSQWTTIAAFTGDSTLQPTAEQWYGLTRYDPGTNVQIQLIGGNWTGSGFSGGTCTAASRTTVEVTDDDIDGTVIYWAPPKTKSVTFAAGLPASNDPVPLPGAICQGCHTVNLANPAKMTYGVNFPGKTNLVDLNDPTTVIESWGNGFTNLQDYGAPDPSGQFVVVSGMNLTGGGAGMAVYSQTTGQQINTISTSRSPTMPNWSPDGAKLVYAGCDGGASALGGGNCDLYVQTWDPSNQTFSGETRIAQHQSGETLYYPSFSPDSKWVAYDRAEQWTETDGSEVTTYANERAKLMLVEATGGTQMELSAANGVGYLTNSWPHWAPSTGNYGWLAYSTKRAYGSQVSDRSQLWVTAINLSAANNGATDPSREPAWIPGQLTSESNHTPIWLPRKSDQ